MSPLDQTSWTQRERDEFAECGYVSFKNEAEVDEWCDLACAETFAELDAHEANNVIGLFSPPLAH